MSSQVELSPVSVMALSTQLFSQRGGAMSHSAGVGYEAGRGRLVSVNQVNVCKDRGSPTGKVMGCKLLGKEGA